MTEPDDALTSEQHSPADGPDEPEDCPMNDQAVALALHALEPDEEMVVRTHLSHCRSCRVTVTSTEIVMGGLAASVPQINPPASLRDTILALTETTPQDVSVRQERARSTATGTTVSASEDTVQRSPSSQPRADSGQRRPAGRPPRRDDSHGPARDSAPGRWRRRSRVLIAAGAAVVALLGLGGTLTYALDLQQQRDTQAATSRALADTITTLGQSNTPRATLHSSAGHAVAVVVADTAHSTVITTGLTANPQDSHTYVLWGIGSSGPIPIGTFDVTNEIGTQTLDQSATAAYTAYAISLEPGRSMPTTPTDVVASGAIRS